MRQQVLPIKAQVLNTKKGTAATLGSGTATFSILKDSDMTVVRSEKKSFSNNNEFNAIRFVVSNGDLNNELGVSVVCDLDGTIL